MVIIKDTQLHIILSSKYRLPLPHVVCKAMTQILCLYDIRSVSLFLDKTENQNHLKSTLQIKNVYVMKQKLCFHAVKAMLLCGRFRHIAAKNKAVLLSKTVVLACFYAENGAQNL